MKKIIAAILGFNALLLAWTLYAPSPPQKTPMLDFLCESTLTMHRHREANANGFRFQGTVVARFKPDATGYLWLRGEAGYAGNKTDVAREIDFRYQPRDEKEIYAITPTAQRRTPLDDTPDALIEHNITGAPGQTGVYVIRKASQNTYSIGNISTPIILCVERS